jgi:hypothetical protein
MLLSDAVTLRSFGRDASGARSTTSLLKKAMSRMFVREDTGLRSEIWFR